MTFSGTGSFVWQVMPKPWSSDLIRNLLTNSSISAGLLQDAGKQTAFVIGNPQFFTKSPLQSKFIALRIM